MRFAIMLGSAIAAACSLTACGIGLNGLGPSDVGEASDSGGSSYDAYAGGDANGEADTSRDETSVANHPPSDSSTSPPDGASDDAFVNPTPTDACTPAGAEDCTNGTDDDCNGLVDCADPACTSAGYACIAAPPSGWSAALFSATSQPGCPAALPTQADVDVDPTDLTSATTCGCTCSLGSPPSCVDGNIATKYGPDNMCNGPGGGGTLVDVPVDGGCLVQTATVSAFIFSTQPALSGGSCTLTSTVTRPSTGASHGQVCSGESAFGGGCSTGQVCALARSGFQACILKPSPQAACPAGPYATAHAVGTLDDTRGCTTCAACDPPTATCAPGTWSFYTAPNCTGPAINLATDSTCNATGAPPTGSPSGSNQFTSAISAVACAAPAPATPTGSAQLDDASTVCCQ